MEYSDSNILVDVEVVRLESLSSEDYSLELESIRHLCNAFSFGLKIIDIYTDGEFSCRQYELYFSPESFFANDYRMVIKTFVLTSNLLIVNSKIIQMKQYDFIVLPSDGTLKEENHITHKL